MADRLVHIVPLSPWERLGEGELSKTQDCCKNNLPRIRGVSPHPCPLPKGEGVDLPIFTPATQMRAQSVPCFVRRENSSENSLTLGYPKGCVNPKTPKRH